MNSTEPPDRQVEERLLAVLAVLQTAPAAVSVGLASAVMRRVRWQRTVRRLLTFAGSLTGSVIDGVLVAAHREKGGKR